ncbi:MAG TPA: response regulator, partial [Rhodospirillales bacterium]|nr:response regulator [Rhodospirillales bacterium]
DLILSDWSPSLDGIRLLHMVRRHEDSPDPYVPFIVISAHTGLNDILTARDAGMTEFLAKPISPKLIYSRIRSVIEKSRIFVRTRNFFGPDRRRRKIALKDHDRRNHSNMNGPERRQGQFSFQGYERRQGYSGYIPVENRMGGR